MLSSKLNTTIRNVNVLTILQQDLDALTKWSETWHMLFNTKKYKIMDFSRSGQNKHSDTGLCMGRLDRFSIKLLLRRTWESLSRVTSSSQATSEPKPIRPPPSLDSLGERLDSGLIPPSKRYTAHMLDPTWSMQLWSCFPTPLRTSTHLRKYKDELLNSFQKSATLVKVEQSGQLKNKLDAWKYSGGLGVPEPQCFVPRRPLEKQREVAQTPSYPMYHIISSDFLFYSLR